MHNSEDKYNTPPFKGLFDELERQFPQCPFVISCVDTIEQLDNAFTLDPVIFIYDDRASPNNYFYSEMSDMERSQYVHYLKIEREDNKPITLRQVIHAMVNDAHYHNEVVMRDPHMFLESFHKSNKLGIQWSCFWGS